MRRDVESHLLATQNRRGQGAAHQALEQNFLTAAADLEPRGQCGGELDDAVIEEGRTNLDGVRHAHSVDLRENVVG